MVDLDEDEVDLIQTVQRLTREEETLLYECWVKVSKNNEIGADRSDYSFWWHITDDFNKATHNGDRTKNMIMDTEDFRRKIQAGESTYEAKKTKEVPYMECKELEFLMIDTQGLPERKAAIIRKKQEAIMAKYN
ncbi:hypothetical protein Tco_0022350 [Tanacetum coccineum]